MDIDPHTQTPDGMPPSRILLIKPSSLGDILHAFPATTLLRQAFPQAAFHWVASDSLAQIVNLYPGLASVIRFPRNAIGHFQLQALRSFYRELRAPACEVAIDFQGLLRSGLMAKCSGAKIRIGFAHGRECSPWFYTHRVHVPPEIRHAADKNLFLARNAIRILGGTPPPEDTREVPLQLPVEWKDGAERLIAAHGLAEKKLLAVGCSSRWESKSWPPEFFAEALRHTMRLQPGIAIWLLGSQQERERAEKVRTLAGLPPESNLAGLTSLGELAALLARSAVMLTNDSGPMHIAAALQVPCVALFGATDDTLTGPYGPPGRHTVIHSTCPKAPCFHRICPLAAQRQCSSGLSPETVAQAIRKALAP